MTCSYIYKKGKNKGLQCTVRPKNGTYCSRHKRPVIKCEIQDNNSTEIDCEESFWAVWRNKYLLQQIYSYIRGTNAILAAKTGNLQAFQFGVLTGYEISPSFPPGKGEPQYIGTLVMNTAAFKGHLDVVRWLHENRNEECANSAIDYIACTGHIDVIKFLFENTGKGCTKLAIENAAMRGHLDLVKWFCKNKKVPCSKRAMNIAAFSGHFETIKWLYKNCKECNVKDISNDCDIMFSACTNDHLDIVKWLCKIGKGCTYCGYDAAISTGKNEVAKWLKNNANISIEWCEKNHLSLMF